MKPDQEADPAMGKPEAGEVELAGDEHAYRARMTKTVLFKVDTRVLPVLALLFLCSFIDRTNVGNAKILTLTQDLHMTDLQYNQGLAVFYATYIASEVPSNLILKRLTPRVWLAFLTCAWGIVTMCIGFVKNANSFIAVRAILGLTEGGLLPGIVLYLSGLYTKREVGLRIGIFYTAASLSGAFGGLLARGLASIGGSLEGWRYIFIIEGLLTFVCGVVGYFSLATNLATASYLTPEEQAFAAKRLSEASPDERFNTARESEEKFQWSEVRRGVFNVQVWLTATAYFGILAGLYSFGLFLPTIINGMGITANANQTQLWSVIPYAVATPITVLVAFISDRAQLRGVILLFTLPVAIAGYAAIANIKSAPARFACTCLMASGLFSSVPCILAWNANNSAGHYKRAVTSALQLALANCGGFVATFIYPKTDGPLFHKGHTVVLGLLCYAWFAVLLNVLYCRKINKDKRSGKYAEFKGRGDAGDRDPEFMMIL